MFTLQLCRIFKLWDHSIIFFVAVQVVQSSLLLLVIKSTAYLQSSQLPSNKVVSSTLYLIRAVENMAVEPVIFKMPLEILDIDTALISA